MLSKLFQRVSAAPTIPPSRRHRPSFDIATLFAEPLEEPRAKAGDISLDEKLRQAYFWIVNSAIISPHYDIEYNGAAPSKFVIGDTKAVITLPSAQSYSSFVLIPLLTFATRRKCLFIGGPGRGKTASAILMGVLAGYSVREVRRAMQHGHPQLTVAELLGNPLPADLLKAERQEDIRIAWRAWLSMRVKIIDEYNRIPTRTQSALLTVLGDNYAEVFGQIFECPESAWFLTANDDRGGGTYQVIEALRDRIDVVVQALSFNNRFLGELLTRIEEQVRPEEVVPPEILFSEEELVRIHREILAIEIPVEVRRRIEFFASHFELCERAAEMIEYRTKDTARLAGIDPKLLLQQESGKDRLADIGAQTRNGLSVRALMTLLHYAKALSYFRGEPIVSLDDVRQVVPFVLFDKLSQESDAQFFRSESNTMYRTDRIGWIRKLFELSCAEYDRLDLDREDPVRDVESEFQKGLEGLSAKECRRLLSKIEQTLTAWGRGKKLYGHVYDDIVKLKYFHQRYTNYLHWLEAQ